MAETIADIAAAKARMRERLRFRRDQYVGNLPEFVQAIAFRAPPAPVRSLLSQASSVGGYLAFGHEAPPDGLMALAAELGTTTALPFFHSRDEPMQFCSWRAGDAVEAGPWRVSQPSVIGAPLAPDLLLCPLLGFDRGGGRIGQGGGHYDRFFAQNAGAVRIGIAWSVQEVDAVPCEIHDLPLDAVLTEQEWILTGNRL